MKFLAILALRLWWSFCTLSSGLCWISINYQCLSFKHWVSFWSFFSMNSSFITNDSSRNKLSEKAFATNHPVAQMTLIPTSLIYWWTPVNKKLYMSTWSQTSISNTSLCSMSSMVCAYSMLAYSFTRLHPFISDWKSSTENTLASEQISSIFCTLEPISFSVCSSTSVPTKTANGSSMALSRPKELSSAWWWWSSIWNFWIS